MAITKQAADKEPTESASVPRHVARHVVEEHGEVYLPGQELPASGHGSPRRHELLAGGWVVDPDQKEG